VKAAIEPSGVPCFDLGSLEEATRRASGLAKSGASGADVVLLSPACASLDMFRNYAHRAEVFVATVQRLADERGVAL
ncbi:MAG TPA: UDP-N-acetylmuramoyl-L-alanine--D-glutamate ligase, partial [Roseateles sp.]|nr:UDP-N-acetylmuramoyl-L-alanine--D-glutamate ligase [Roseateles sp.]